MTTPIAIYTDGRSFYCLPCLGGEDQLTAGGYYDHMRLLEEDLSQLGAGEYCCNCGRHNGGNEDAHRPGRAVQEDFEFADDSREY